MSIPVLTAEEIERLLPMGDCIAVMEQAFTDLQRGSLHHPLRTFWAPPGVNGGTMWMAAYRSSPKPMFGTARAPAATRARGGAHPRAGGPDEPHPIRSRCSDRWGFLLKIWLPLNSLPQEQVA